MPQERLVSLDAFRGITIAGMILVNNPGSWNYVYPPFRHAVWHGWTPTDLVFPFFVFIVGCSVSLAVSRRIGEGAGRADLYFKIFKRSAIIFLLGILLHLIPRFNFAAMRIPGVLQRIALCYFFAALLYVHFGVRGRAAAVVIALVAYWLAMKLVPVPGYGAGVLNFHGNLCSYIDAKLLAGHLHKPEFDPEGILSTLPAIATAVLGTLAGDWLRSSKKALVKAGGLAVAGGILAGLGLALHPHFPINKQLWTSTFVLFSGGAALLLLAGCYFLIDARGLKTWATPFYVFGTNAIATFVGSTLVVKLLLLVKVPSGGEKIGLLSFIYQRLFATWAGDFGGSLAYAVIYVLIWLAIMTPLYRKRIFIRI